MHFSTMGAYIRSKRLAADLTIADVSERTGLSADLLIQVEMGSTTLDVRHWECLRQALPEVSTGMLRTYALPWPGVRVPSRLWFWWRKSGVDLLQLWVVYTAGSLTGVTIVLGSGAGLCCAALMSAVTMSWVHFMRRS